MKAGLFLVNGSFEAVFEVQGTNGYTQENYLCRRYCDIGIEFVMKKCGILTMKRGKIVRYGGIRLQYNEVMKEVVFTRI